MSQIFSTLSSITILFNCEEIEECYLRVIIYKARERGGILSVVSRCRGRRRVDHGREKVSKPFYTTYRVSSDRPSRQRRTSTGFFFFVQQLTSLRKIALHYIHTHLTSFSSTQQKRSFGACYIENVAVWTVGARRCRTPV